jgi:hypothetical protein
MTEAKELALQHRSELFLRRRGSQTASITLTPSLVETGVWKEFVQKFQDFRYALGVIHSRRWAHNDAAESISFDVVWQTRHWLVWWSVRATA